MLLALRRGGHVQRRQPAGPAICRSAGSTTAASRRQAGKGFRIRAHTGTVSEEGNTRKRTKVAGQQVPSAAKFTAPVEMPVELQSVGDVSLRADGNSGNGELLEPSRTQLSDLAQTAAKAAAELHDIRQEAFQQQQMMGVYEELLAGIAADYKDMLLRQVAAKQAAAQAGSADVLALQTTNSRMAEQLQTLQVKLEQQQVHIRCMDKEKKGYKQQLRAAIAEVEDLKHQLMEQQQNAQQHHGQVPWSAVAAEASAAAQEEQEVLQQQAVDLQAQLSAVLDQLAAALSEKDSVTQQLLQVKVTAEAAAAAAASSAAAEKQQLQARVEALEAELGGARQQQQAALDDNAALRQHLQQADSQAQGLLDSINTLASELQHLEAQQMQQVAQVSALQVEKATMVVELRSAALQLHKMRTAEHQLLRKNEELSSLLDQQQAWQSSIVASGLSTVLPDPWRPTNSSCSVSPSLLHSVQTYRGYQAFPAPKLGSVTAPAAKHGAPSLVESQRRPAECHAAVGLEPSKACTDAATGGVPQAHTFDLLFGASLSLSMLLPMAAHHLGMW